MRTIITPPIKQMNEKNLLAFATVNARGKPNIIGVAFIKVVGSTTVVIMNNYLGKTVENIAQNPSVALSV